MEKLRTKTLNIGVSQGSKLLSIYLWHGTLHTGYIIELIIISKRFDNIASKDSDRMK